MLKTREMEVDIIFDVFVGGGRGENAEDENLRWHCDVHGIYYYLIN